MEPIQNGNGGKPGKIPPGGTGSNNAAQNSKNARELEKIRELSRQFESIVVGMMIKNMRDTVTPGGVIEQNQGEKIFRSMLDEKYASEIAKQDSVGISKLVYDDLVRKYKLQDNQQVTRVSGDLRPQSSSPEKLNRANRAYGNEELAPKLQHHQK